VLVSWFSLAKRFSLVVEIETPETEYRDITPSLPTSNTANNIHASQTTEATEPPHYSPDMTVMSNTGIPFAPAPRRGSISVAVSTSIPIRFNGPPRHPSLPNGQAKPEESTVWNGARQPQQQETQGPPFSENQRRHHPNGATGILNHTLSVSSTIRKGSNDSSVATEMQMNRADEEIETEDAGYDENDTVGEDTVGQNVQQIPGMDELNARHPTTWSVGDVQLWLRSIGISLQIVEIFGGMMRL
jgi:hypothetical protein